MYKCLSTEEKQRWEAHAAQDKARYEAEMTTYGEFWYLWISYLFLFVIHFFLLFMPHLLCFF
jgi:hypothetical protein